jgi:hypothetical protein
MDINKDFLDLFGEIDERLILAAGNKWENTRQKRWKNIRKYAMIAGLLLLVVLGSVSHKELVRAFTSFVDSIGSWLHPRDDLTDYENILNTTIEKENLSITLEEVILTTDSLYVSVVAADQEGGGEPVLKSELSINGEAVTQSEMYAPLQEIEADSYREIVCYRFDTDILHDGKNEIQLRYITERISGNAVENTSGNISGDTSEHISGNNSGDTSGSALEDLADNTFLFTFTASKDELSGQSITKALSQEITFLGGYSMTLENFTWNAVESKITGNSDSLPKEIDGYDVSYYLIGTDNEGNPVKYRNNQYIKPELTFVSMPIESVLNPEAAQLKLQLYVCCIPKDAENAADYDIDPSWGKEDLEENTKISREEISDVDDIFMPFPVGEEFTITIQNHAD